MAARKVYIVGAGQPTLEDVMHVALGQAITLDAAAADRIKKDSPPPKSFEPEDAPNMDSSAPNVCLDKTQSRATLFFKLNSLINGKSKCRVAVLDALSSMLNEEIIPRLPSGDLDSIALRAIADALHGVGSAVTSVGIVPASEAFEGAKITPPGLSSAERAAIQDGQSASASTGAICVQSGRALVTAATAIAALSAEALQADVKSFDAETAEALPLKGASDVADSLRSLLEGSRQVNAKKAGVGVLQALSDVPVVHGSAMQDVTNAAMAVKAVLASAAVPAAKDGSPQQIASPALTTSLLSLASSLLRCSLLSLKRAGVIRDRLAAKPPSSAEDGAAPTTTPGSNSNTAGVAAGLAGAINASAIVFEAAQKQISVAVSKASLAEADPPSLAAANAAYFAIRALQQALEVEALAAVVSLRVQEGIPAEPMIPVEAPAPAATNGVDVEAGGKSKKNKKDKKGPAGMALGRGTLLLRSSLEATIAAAIDGVDELSASFLALSFDDASAAASQLRAGCAALHTQLDPCGPALPRHLAAVQAVLDANAATRKPKVAKGARDFAPDQMAIREVAFSKIVSVFKRHGAVSIDTPVFELRETLMGKYGEDSKLIYDLADQGGEILSLRYDLTVPFARYVAVNGVTNIKRYHIAKVYRRDQPAMNRGRFREFFQCDFDIAGAYASMVPDAEVLKVLVEILDDLALGEYEVKLNHRRLLDAMLDIAGVPPQKFRPICSAIDKLDKEPWEVVRAEMVEEKGLAGDVADKIGEFVVLRGEPRALLARLTEAAHPLAVHPDSASALVEMGTLFEFLDGMGALGSIVFDLSLARGLDYYTGVIYEAVLKGGIVGSIAAGGRYDKLVGMFSGKEVPAVGVSIGIERVFAIMEAQMRAAAAEAGGTIRETETDVLVASIGNGLQARRMTIASKLWAAGVKAEFGFKPNPKMGDQLGYALKSGIPLMVLFGEDELNRGIVKLKDLDAGTEEEVAESELPQVAAARAAAKGERRIVYATAKTADA